MEEMEKMNQNNNFPLNSNRASIPNINGNSTGSFQASSPTLPLSPLTSPFRNVINSAVSTFQPTQQQPISAGEKRGEVCIFAVSGRCKFGTSCRNIHGLQCPRCLQFCLHPTDLDRNEKHIEECLSNHLAPPSSPFSPTNVAGTNDEELECGICYEPVKQKSDPRFGLLACEHVFCLQCIRTWRAKHAQNTVDNLRSCPMCRTLTYFVTPSTEWVANPSRKTKIIDDYKKNLGQIPCAYFNYGEGNCPFGSSCFYAHRHRDGTEAEPERIRAYVDSNEQVKTVRETKLSDFVQFSLTQNRKSNNNNKK